MSWLMTMLWRLLSSPQADRPLGPPRERADCCGQFLGMVEVGEAGAGGSAHAEPEAFCQSLGRLSLGCAALLADQQHQRHRNRRQFIVGGQVALECLALDAQKRV